jgi:hypothetical protein
MSLWCVQSGRHRLRKLAGAALCALLAVAFFGCGRTAPEDIWEPTKADTAGIDSTVTANKGLFRTGLAELAMQMCDTALPGTTRTILYDELTGNRFKGRFRLDSMQHVLDSHEFRYTFIAGLNLDSLLRVDSSKNPWETTWVEPGSETTCTVTMAETIPGKVLMHAWEKTNYLRDSVIIVPPAETLRLPFYSETMTPCDTTITKPIIDGASIEGCVLKKVNGVWQLWKMAGGGRFYAPGPDDAPYIVSLALKGANNRLDSVYLRPDTTRFGIQRFYSVDDQLLTYAVGDWLIAPVGAPPYFNPYTNQGNAYDYLYFNGKRYELGDTVKFAAADTGIHRLSLEHIPATVLWEVDAATSPYNATTWGIPIRIQ